jgi:hypothetical protein
MGFGVPLAGWLRSSLREVLIDTVLSDRALSRGYFKPASLRAMVDVHMAGGNRYQHVLWGLLMLERWHQMFIDQRPVPRFRPLAHVPSLS